MIINEIEIETSVYQQIKNSIGTMLPEQGGLLGGNFEDRRVTHFYFDQSADRSEVTYSPDIATVNKVLENWNAEGIRLLGVVHSHPTGVCRPSSADVEYAGRILKHNADAEFFVMPIVQSAANSPEFEMRMFCAELRKSRVCVERIHYDLIADAEVALERLGDDLSDETSELFLEKIQSSYDRERLSRTRIIGVGCGGASAFYEEAARMGFGEFVLIDPDVVEGNNLATQQTYRSDLGKPKVECVAKRIADINPGARVEILHQELEVTPNDDFDRLFGEALEESAPVPAVTILCGFTDSFKAQALCNRLALQYGSPLLTAQIYEGGRGAEIIFQQPGVTHACMRCIASSRYRAYLDMGFRNDVTSAGSSLSTTTQVNAVAEFILLALAHHGTSHPRWGKLIERIGNRNLIQLRCDPDIDTTLGLPNFQQAFEGVTGNQLFNCDVIWREQHPENAENGYEEPCLDCGGVGDLRQSAGKIINLRKISEKPSWRYVPGTFGDSKI